MKPQTNLHVSSIATSSRLSTKASLPSFLIESSPWRASGPASWVFAAAISLLALACVPAQLTAQQGYPAPPNGGYASPYAGQYSQPDAQPAQPQYAQPQYSQPQYAQPQYSQPQYAPPDAQPPYANTQPPYTAGSPATGSPYDQSQQQDLAEPAVPAQAPLSAEQLEQLLAPIALYPDALLAQILTASTYPAQVAVADQWLGQMRTQGYGSPDQIAAGAEAQGDWDPSVKSLTATPDVLDMMNHNLEWTTNLGNAYYNQPQDVMQTVQVLRGRAQQAGNLQSTPQEDVSNDQGYIELAPANPQVVCVPTYDPWDVYGQPVAPYPGFSLIGALGSFFGGAPIQYGLGFALAAFEHMPFGWMGWGLDWLAHAVLFNHANYFTHSDTVADWGLPRGGPRAYYGRGGSDRTRDGPYRNYGAQQANNQRGFDQRGAYANRAYANRTPAQPYARPAVPAREAPRPDSYSNRGYQQPASGYTHPALPGQSYARPAPQNYARVAPQQNYGDDRPQTYPNRPQTYASRPQQTFSNPGYANRPTPGYGNTGQGYASRPNYAYANPSYRAPQYTSPASSGRAYASYGNSMARNDRSTGSHLFGNDRAPRGYSSERAPKYSYKAPKGFSGGREKAPNAPRMSRSGGGRRR